MRRRRGLMVLVVAVVALTGALAGMSLVFWQPWRGGTEHEAAPRHTARVERTTLSADLVLSAQLEYSSPVTLIGTAGILTRLPRAGDVIAAGQPFYEVDGRSVVMFVGDRPLWRNLEGGVSDGPDIREVEQNLSDLGYGAGLTVDDTFTTATDRAIRSWQKDHGRERTGSLEPGDVVMVASESVRVSAVTAALGASAGSAVLSYTDPSIRGRVKLSAAQLTQLAPGLAVSVRLPSGADIPAVVGAVDPGGAATSDPSKPSSPSAEIDFGDQSVLRGIGLPALRVTVGTDHADDALVVPVMALVALASGGYAVEVPAGANTTLVPVTVGLVADSRAEVRDGSIAAGDEVVVPG